MRDFDNWNEVKKTIHQSKEVYFKERDIFWAKIGKNIGFEQNGKGEEFTRPIVIIKKYTKDIFLAVPLSTTLRSGSFFYQFSFIENKMSTALLVQNRLFSSKRLVKKIGKINQNDFLELKQKLIELID